MMNDTSENLPYGVYWVQPGKLLAGPNPASWNDNQTRQRLRRLLDLDVTFFLDFTEAGEAKDYQLQLSSEAALRRDTVYRRMPIRDMDVAAQDHMAAILAMIDAALGRGHIVYMHCMAGLGRTGTVAGCYLVRQGMPGQDALEALVRRRGGRGDSPQTDEQCSMVRTWHEGNSPNPLVK